MSKQILINSNKEETRIALLEDNRVNELFFERSSDKGIVGNVYKGRVVRVLPGMQAAFVDIGHERAAFLYAGDFVRTSQMLDEDFDEEQFGRRGRRRRSSEDVKPINELVKEGQEILVQVAKGPIGTKGARVTSHISLPGRYLVFMPTLRHNGVSRKIESYEARKRLKKIIDQCKSDEGGFIVRTAASTDAGVVTEKEVRNDVEYLLNLWQKIQRKVKQNAAPKLLHYDLDLTTRMIRDHLDEDVDFFIVDDPAEHRRVLKFIRHFNPALKNKVELYQEPTPLFDRFGVENEIHKTLGKRVWLKSGGYLIIEFTEALTSIDVNTGRFVGKKNLEETILRTNLESAEEIVRQLRLRNVGGIIIIDFIDMEKDSSKDQVYRYLDKLVRQDKQKTTILKISSLGLVEMTRKRSREPIHRYHLRSCNVCDGRGMVKSPDSLAHQCLRDLRRELPHSEVDSIQVTVHPEVAQVLNGQEKSAVIELEKQFQKGIKVDGQADFHYEQIAITPSNAPKPKAAGAIVPLAFMATPSQEWLDHKEEERKEWSEQDEKDYQSDTAEVQSYRNEQMSLAAEEAKEKRDAEAQRREEKLKTIHEREPDYSADWAASQAAGENSSRDADDDESEIESPVIREGSEVSNDRQDDDFDDDDDEDTEIEASHSNVADDEAETELETPTYRQSND